MIRPRIPAAVAALVTLAVLGGSGAAVAGWTASASVSASASSTTIATAIEQTGALSTSYRYAGTTSTAAAGQLTIRNNGGAPLSYSLTSSVTGHATLAQKTMLRLWTGMCGATAPLGAVITTLADAAPALPAAARTLAPGASVVVCVSTQVEGASNASLQGQSVTATFGVKGAVGTSWTTSATTAAVTQSVYRLAAAGTPMCAPVPFTNDVRLTWSAPLNRADAASLSYRVYDTASGATVATVNSAGSTVSTVLSGHAISSNGRHALAVEARETTGSGTTAPASATVSVTRSTGLLDPLQFFPGYHCS
ncbi:hypothetical protein HF576_03070 [Microbacterium sp. CFH 90308]|uniref:Fibronectin type-III domain-containing protein n=1 Tax=Microbacterium salsuginis TaxID=2722803 RepID=A0ABX1K8Z0_9MICO|nr:hypothetical protein [Microbacterium sp. CFH 90308]NLP82818.1 hypothetical protein [Microbacterium sp. CFH 90308]